MIGQTKTTCGLSEIQFGLVKLPYKNIRRHSNEFKNAKHLPCVVDCTDAGRVRRRRERHFTDSEQFAGATSHSDVATVLATNGCPAVTLSGVDAQTLTGDSTPLRLGTYGTRRPDPPVLVNGKHSPANYRPAPAIPRWQFATSDPTNGALTFECDVAPDVGWHSYKRNGSAHQKLVVTAGATLLPNLCTRSITASNSSVTLPSIPRGM